jgi:hypothetical protein
VVFDDVVAEASQRAGETVPGRQVAPTVEPGLRRADRGQLHGDVHVEGPLERAPGQLEPGRGAGPVERIDLIPHQIQGGDDALPSLVHEYQSSFHEASV